MIYYEYNIAQDTQGQFNAYTLQNQINAIVDTIGQSVHHIEADLTTFKIFFDIELDQTAKNALDVLVSNHNGLTTVEYLTDYLDASVMPFIKNLINTFAAENISMGITQSGKTGHVLGLFEKQYQLSYPHPISLKSSFDTGSLYVSREILQYVRDNPSEYDNMSPFVTDARLLDMKKSIETFLGLPLST